MFPNRPVPPVCQTLMSSSNLSVLLAFFAFLGELLDDVREPLSAAHLPDVHVLFTFVDTSRVFRFSRVVTSTLCSRTAQCRPFAKPSCPPHICRYLARFSPLQRGVTSRLRSRAAQCRPFARPSRPLHICRYISRFLPL